MGTRVFPLDRSFDARYLRFRYHNNGVKATVIRMPTAISVYTGTAGESLEIPALGRHVAAGKLTTDVLPHASVTLPLTSHEALTSGAYLVAVKVLAEGDRTYLSWQNLMVMPRPLTATASSRFGINGADASTISNFKNWVSGTGAINNSKWPFVSAEKGELPLRRFARALACQRRRSVCKLPRPQLERPPLPLSHPRLRDAARDPAPSK